MCGIAFFINYHPKRLMDLGLVKTSFQHLEERGTDASGIYWERDTKKHAYKKLIKAPCTATELWEKIHNAKCDKKEFEPDDKFFNQYKLNGRERVILLHTRKKTKGDEENNNNNMPIFSDNYVLIHNGMISNARRKDYDYKGEVDSEEILASIEKYGVTEGLKKINGTLAVAFKEIHKDNLYVYRSKNPLRLIYNRATKLLIGISDDDLVDIKNEDVVLSKNLFNPNILIRDIPEGALYKLGTREKSITFEGIISGGKDGEI